ncbi:4Fe-4S binding protein [Clostridium sp. JNZ X4-2]
MNRQDLIKNAGDFVENSEDNYITEETAISENIIGMKIFEKPILAFGNADDKYFSLLKQPSAIGKHFLSPKEWLSSCRTVISFFLPFSKAVRQGNGENMSWPSAGWLHGRIEGQKLVNKLCMHLKSQLVNEGYNSVVPSLDKRFWAVTSGSNSHPGLSFTSNWSERHAAFVCGMGTFGLSKGLITQKGMAGRFGSILTELYLPADIREYKDIYEYCLMCGKCIKNCPVNAISIKNGKNHNICSEFLNETAEKYRPRYGCGKCQINVPCEHRIPDKLKIL